MLYVKLGRILLRLGMYPLGERRWSFNTAIDACVIEENQDGYIIAFKLSAYCDIGYHSHHDLL